MNQTQEILELEDHCIAIDMELIGLQERYEQAEYYIFWLQIGFALTMFVAVCGVFL